MMGFSLIIIRKWWIKWLLLSSPLFNGDSDLSISKTESEEGEMNDFEDQEELEEPEDSMTLDEY